MVTKNGLLQNDVWKSIGPFPKNLEPKIDYQSWRRLKIVNFWLKWYFLGNRKYPMHRWIVHRSTSLQQEVMKSACFASAKKSSLQNWRHTTVYVTNILNVHYPMFAENNVEIPICVYSQWMVKKSFRCKICENLHM